MNGAKTGRLKSYVKENVSPETVDRVREIKYGALGPLERLMGHRRERERFATLHGYPLNLERPRSFNEKVCWRKIYDRNPLFPIVVDKYRVREFVELMLGKSEAKQYLTPLLFVTRDPQEIPFSRLPAGFVIKANHGSAMNIVAPSGSRLRPAQVRSKCEKWLGTTHGLYAHEWAYAKVERCIIGEELIPGEGSGPPREMKLHMFDGECGLIQMHDADAWYDGHTLDSGDIVTITFYTPDWVKVDMVDDFPSVDGQAPPENLNEIIDLARRLSKPFDYIRVDLYLAGNEVRFGELTVYPGGGMTAFTPTHHDFELGERWRIPGP